MLDESLPTFHVRNNPDSPGHDATLYLSQYGNEPSPAYTLRRPDPALPGSKNCFALGLSDCYYPDILFGEVLLRPEWNNQSPSSEQIRLNGGIPPPPEPTVPKELNLLLYNPDQQVVVKQKPGSWGGSPSWEFELPQYTFRQPSGADIDRVLASNPASAATTPKIHFKWKRESKLSKDLVCIMSGLSTNPDGTKKKNREPDITVALSKSLKEITLYQPNMERIDMEDPKGFEVVLLLSAITIRELYLSNPMKAFNIDVPGRKTTTTSPKPTSPTAIGPSGTPDPLTQWAIDAETARARQEAAAADRAERVERERIQKMLEAEEREARRKQQAAVDAETVRLRKVYEAEQRAAEQQLQERKPNLPPRHSAPLAQAPWQSPPGQQSQYPPPGAWSGWTPQQPPRPVSQQGPLPGPPPQQWHGPYLQPQAAQTSASMSGFFDGSSGDSVRPRRSFFGLGGSRDDGDPNKLTRKKSAIF